MPGGRIDTERAFVSLNMAVLTVSDSRNESNDSSGDLLAQRIAQAGHQLRARALLRHEKSAIQRQVRAWVNDAGIDVIISNGGTGLAPRDVSPEAIGELFDRQFEGFSVLWHLVSYDSVGVSTMQSRACAGIAAGTVIYVLPGSTGACADGWDKLIHLQLDSRHRPCSVVELLSRLQKP
jgi:molybdenum cofactor biosynthesis protein B